MNNNLRFHCKNDLFVCPYCAEVTYHFVIPVGSTIPRCWRCKDLRDMDKQHGDTDEEE